MITPNADMERDLFCLRKPYKSPETEFLESFVPGSVCGSTGNTDAGTEGQYFLDNELDYGSDWFY